MIHYHGTPLGGRRVDRDAILHGRHALVSFARDEDIEVVAESCQSFVLDNGAFSAWRSGEPVTDWGPYYEWCEKWLAHPGCDWAIIPDVIDGSEQDNDDLLANWPWDYGGVPVWHYHESLERLDRLVSTWPRVALGSSGEWSVPGNPRWWRRTAEVMSVACHPCGTPRTKLHGLRMLNPAIFHRIPLASADSANASRNRARNGRAVDGDSVDGAVITMRRIESHNSAARWIPVYEAPTLAFMSAPSPTP